MSTDTRELPGHRGGASATRSRWAVGSSVGPEALLLALVGLVATTLGPVYSVRQHLLGGYSGSWEDDPFVVGVFALLYLWAATVAVRRWRPGRMGRLVATPAALLCALAVTSAAWAEVPTLVLRRGLLLSGTTVLAIVIGALLRPRHLVAVTAAAMTAATWLSGLVAVVRPGVGRQADGAWVGLYFNRNSLAPVAALSVLALVALATAEPDLRRRGAAAVAAVPSVAVLWATGGRTAQVALVVALVVLGGAALLPVLRRRGVAAATAATAALAAIAVAAGSVAVARTSLLELADRGTDLENRVPLWGYVVDRVSTEPWLGHGFYGYWASPLTAYDTFQALRWTVPTAHNGMLETLLGLGIAGGLLLAATVAVVAATTARAAWWRTTRWSHLLAPLAGFCIAANLAESFVLPNQAVWVLLVAAGACAAAEWDRSVVPEQEAAP